MAGEPVLSIRNLTKRFGGLTAVKDVSLDIYSSEVVAILGDNGAGKSVLIKCVSGVHSPNSGQIKFDGEDVHFTRPIEARDRGIETIYQDLALANNLDVPANIFLGREMENSRLGGLVRSLNDARMLKLSEEALGSLDVRLPALDVPIETLSGGQRQAVAIARAVYWDAKLMIMDEPTNNLGVPEQRKVLELIRKLRERGVPVILISHTLPDVFAVADRLVVMHRGRKVTEKKVTETNQEEIVQYMVGALDDTQDDAMIAWEAGLAGSREFLIETVTEALTQAKLTKLIHLSPYLVRDLLHYGAESCARSNDLPKAVRLSGNSKLADIMLWPAFLDTPEFCRV